MMKKVNCFAVIMVMVLCAWTVLGFSQATDEQPADNNAVDEKPEQPAPAVEEEVDKPEPAVNPANVCMEIDGVPVTYTDLVKEFTKSFPDETARAIESVIVRVVIDSKIKQNATEIPEDLLEERFKFNVDRVNTAIVTQYPELDLDRYLQALNKPKDEFFRELRDKAREQLEAEFVLGPELLRSDRMQVSMIVTKDRATADIVAQKLAEGVSFKELSDEHNVNESTRATGGVIGTFTKALLEYYDAPEDLKTVVMAVTADGPRAIIDVSNRGSTIYHIDNFRAATILSKAEEDAKVLEMIVNNEITDMEMSLFLYQLKADVKIKDYRALVEEASTAKESAATPDEEAPAEPKNDENGTTEEQPHVEKETETPEAPK